MRRPVVLVLAALALLLLLPGAAAARGVRASAAVQPQGASAADPLAALAVQQAALTATSSIFGDEFGYSVAISGDTAVVGADGVSSDTGAAYVFTRSASVWSQQQKLTATDGAAGDQFGYSVALSGETAVVGAYGVGSGTGAAYVFTRSGTVWRQQQKLTATGGAAGDLFGCSVALSGETAVVGAYGVDTWTGAAYVFKRSGTVWSQQQKLTATGGAVGDWFGYSVALSGETAVVGSFWVDPAKGAAYVFTRSGSVWSQQQELTATGAVDGDHLGCSVALSGNTALVGAYCASSDTGAAYVFTRSGSVWSQKQKLTATGGAANDRFGYSVALSGETAVVGAWGASSYTGAAYVFTRSASVWSQQQKLTATGAAAGGHVGSADRFGYSVALSGETAVVGAVAGGAAYAFTRSASAWSQRQELSASAPTLTKLSPTSGKRGATITLSGTGFGAMRVAGSVSFGSAKATVYLSWSDATVTCKVPAKAKLGKLKVTLTAAAGTTSALSFTVKR
jgi:hypothetical protein